MLWVPISVLWNLFICLDKKTHERSMKQGYSIKTQGLKGSHNWAWSPEPEFLLLWLSLCCSSTGLSNHWMRPIPLIRVAYLSSADWMLTISARCFHSCTSMRVWLIADYSGCSLVDTQNLGSHFANFLLSLKLWHGTV